LRAANVKANGGSTRIMSGKILFVSDDVMFWATVRARAAGLGCDIARIDGDAAMAAAVVDGGVTRVIADLGSRSVDACAWAPRLKALDPAPELIAFGSHVNEGSLAAARAAGFDRVMANSAFVRSLDELLR
jgi:hypothetical protein